MGKRIKYNTSVLTITMLFTVILATLITESITRSTNRIYPRLPDTYKDIFVNGGGKPTLGSTTSTCWIRGGTCLHIRKCPSMIFDAGVTGCTTRFKVCCKNFVQLPPTVGIQRSQDLSESSEEDANDEINASDMY